MIIYTDIEYPRPSVFVGATHRFTHHTITNLFTSRPFGIMRSHTEIILDVWQHLDALVSVEDSKPITLTGHKLTIPDIVAIARWAILYSSRERCKYRPTANQYNSYNVVTEISNTALESMEQSLSALQNGLRDGHIIYGNNPSHKPHTNDH